MALVVLSKIEQRLDAVRAVLAGADVTAVAASLGVHLSSVHRWTDEAQRLGGTTGARPDEGPDDEDGALAKSYD